MAMSPTVESSPFSSDDWKSYVEYVGSIADQIQIAGFFNGAKDAGYQNPGDPNERYPEVWHNSGFYNYSLKYEPGSDKFYLEPEINSQIKGVIEISGEDLRKSIYQTEGSIGLYTSNGGVLEPFALQYIGTNEENVAWNDQWGTVMTQVLTGFTAGYYGTKGEYTASGETVDLNQNWNWDPTFAFDAAAGSGAGSITSKPAEHFSDPYSKFFFLNSNSYGGNYSDNLMSAYVQGGPLLDVGGATGLKLKIFSNSDTRTGYQTPQIDNKPAGGGSWIQPGDASNLQLKLNFSAFDMILDPKTALSIDVYRGGSGQDAVWETIALNAGSGSPWNIWTIEGGPGAYTATVDTTSQGAGKMLITGLPAGQAGEYWYRINVGSGDDKKTFNLYAIVEGDQGALKFKNSPTDQAIDGLARLDVGDASNGVLVVNFAYGDTITVDPDLMIRNTSATTNSHIPDAPVVGTLVGSDFSALAGQTTQANNTSTIASTVGELAFAWAGENDAPGAAASSWIGGYTNKIGATNTALVSLTSTTSNMLYMSPLAAEADLDGKWMTSNTFLSNGTYSVKMTEYAAGDLKFATALAAHVDKTDVTYSSETLTLQVEIPKLGLLSGDDGSLYLDSSASPTTAGNWLSFKSIDAASLAVGASIVLYATDASGALVDALTGEAGGSVSLKDATLGSIGNIRSDSGSLLMNGASNVYLESEHRLKFAVISKNGEITMDAPVSAQSGEGGLLGVNVGGFDLSVETDNDLTPEAQFASAQRLYGDELVYAEKGHKLQLDVTGSAAQTNRLGFVEIEIDPASGDWSVDGVAYSDDQAFKDAVLANLDGGLSVTAGGGTFDETYIWTVEGDSGFYAPVLITPDGDLFVIGEANPGGNEQIRSFGNNLFGFEDMTEDEGADFDYNDMVMQISPYLDGGMY